MIFEVISALVLGGVVVVIIDYIITLHQLKRYPPGPLPLPLIGNLHMLRNIPVKEFKRLGKDYGNVLSFSFGRERIVIIQGIEAAREALMTNGVAFAGRPHNNFVTSIVTRGYQDIIFADYGSKLRAMRKIAHGALKMYGEGLNKLEESVVEEIEKLLQRIDEKNGQAFDPTEDLELSVTNIICAILFGKRFQMDDVEFHEIVHAITLIRDFDITSPVNFLTLLRYLPNKPLSNLKRGTLNRDTFLTAKLDEHKKSFDAGNLRDFTDLLLYMLSVENAEGNSTSRDITDVNLEMILSDLFLAGVETTSTTLRWGLLFLAKWPDVQRKVAEEMRKTLGERQPCLKDRGSLPYFEAVVHEILRMSSVAPLGVPHKTISDTKCQGHGIPAGTQVWFNIWALHNDENEWDTPDAFKPERFLDEKGDFVIGAKRSYLPFMAGRRVCLGEGLAKTELFLFLSSILYRYEVASETGDPPDSDGIFSIVYVPKPFRVKLIKRKGISES